MLLLLLSTVTSYAQESAEQLESQADVWVGKSFTHSKAYVAYYHCFTANSDVGAQCRVLDKVVALMEKNKLLMNNNAAVVDSLIDAARTTYSDDTAHYLPLLEERIIRSMTTSNNISRAFALFDEARAIRQVKGLQQGEAYERLLAWYMSKKFYCSNETKADTLKTRSILTDYAALVAQSHGNESREYVDALQSVVDTYDMFDAEAVPLLQELLPLQERLLGANDIAYQATKSKLILLLSQSHHLQEAITIQQATANDEDIFQLISLADNQSKYGQYREAISTSEKILEYCADHQLDDGLSLNFFGAAYSVTNSFSKLKDVVGTIGFGRKWCNDSRLDYSWQKLVYNDVVNTLVQFGRDYDQIIAFIDDYVAAHPEAMSDVAEWADATMHKADCAIKQNDAKGAETVIRQILAALKQGNADQTLIMKYEQYLEVCYMVGEDWDKAKSQNQLVLNMLSQMPNYKQYMEYVSLQCRMVFYEDLEDDFDEVLRLCRIIDDFDAANSTQLFPSTINLTFFGLMTTMLTSSAVDTQRYRALCRKGMNDEAATRIAREVVEKKGLVKFTLSQLDNSWSQNTDYWMRQFCDNLCNVAVKVRSDTLAMQTFDYMLLYKQSFLAAESLMRHQLLESGNEELKEKFQTLQQQRTALRQQEKSGLPVDDLREQVVRLERQIVEDSQMYGDFMSGFNLGWGDIRSRLRPSDVAIEFVSYTSFADSLENVAALLLRHDWTSPKLVHLFSTGQMPTDVYSGHGFAQMLWGPIMPYLEDANCIYFAPAGVIYNINIESLVAPSGEGYMADSFQIYRLSSTRELTAIADDAIAQEPEAVVYGGLEYLTTVDGMVEDSKKYQTQVSTEGSSSAVSAMRGAVASIPNLPGTKVEADNIVGILTAANGHHSVRLLSGLEGTEASFKALSGRQSRIMHIATHGFYNVPQKQTVVNRLMIKPQDSEDIALSRTGLLLVGAENTLQGDNIPDGVDDGVLTAMEISAMDLRGLDLVSLSACQTAQGDLRTDGVFGLQRGFKKAGADSILMTLWQVDDEATCMLMTEFYKHWTSGSSKHDALEQAKHTVRSHTERGWDQPRYWASFVLLDGLN